MTVEREKRTEKECKDHEAVSLKLGYRQNVAGYRIRLCACVCRIHSGGYKEKGRHTVFSGDFLDKILKKDKTVRFLFGFSTFGLRGSSSVSQKSKMMNLKRKKKPSKKPLRKNSALFRSQSPTIRRKSRKIYARGGES